MLQLSAETRNIFGKKLKRNKKEGRLPAVLYGKGKKSIPLFVNLNEFKKVWNQAEESTVIQLKGDSKDTSIDVLIYDTAIDPIKREFIHADFFALDVDKPITASAPIIFEGVSPAVKEHGGVLIKVLHEIKIEALPKDFPHEIKIDVSLLANIGDKILVKDINLPKVNILDKGEQIIVLAKPHEEEKAEEAPLKIEDIELSEKKGKKEEEGEEGAATPGGKTATETKKESKK